MTNNGPRRWTPAAWGLLLLCLFLLSCGEAGSDSMSAADGELADGDARYDGDSHSPQEDGDESAPDGDDPSDGDVYVPPEQEKQRMMSLPKTGKDYVFILNREAGTLVMIDTLTLEIKTLPVGSDPLVVEPLPGDDVALVIDADTDKLVLALAKENRSVSWPMGEERLTRYNSVSISPDGRFAVLFFNSLLADLSSEGLGSLQEVGLVDLREIERLDELSRPIQPVTVGLNPTQVSWAGGGERALVVTDMGITAIGLKNPGQLDIVPNIPLEDMGGNPTDREVRITSDGRYCLVRRFNQKSITMVDLERSDRISLEFEAAPTDLDLTGDGLTALVMLRELDHLAAIAIPEDFEDSEEIEWIEIPESAGVLEVGPDDDTLLLYSTLNSQEILWSYRLSEGIMNEFFLQKGVESVAFAPTGDGMAETALIFHSRTSGIPNNTDDLYEIIDKSFGYTVLLLRSGMQVLQLTEADQGAFTFLPDGGKGYLVVTNESNIRQVHILDLGNSQGANIKEMELSSVPTGVGLIPGGERIYVSQEHPDGRITFIDAESDEPITVTGFELNGRID